MKAAELKELSLDELTRKAGELRENLFNLKIRRRAGTLESVSDVTKNKKYKCNDEHQSAKPGDKVRIVETRPMSKEKRWRVAEVLVKAEAESQVKAEGQVT